MEGYYITASGKRYEFNPKNTLSLFNMNITELVIPNGVKEVWCFNNKLTELIIPDGVKEVWCFNNKLTELILPDGVKTVSCRNNKLTELILPDGVNLVLCDITALDINKYKNMEHVDITLHHNIE